MELVYLWVEDYKNIQKQGFNFSPRFNCHYNEDNNELTIDENKDCIPDFFGENINVTAIVGKNGSGKSSVFEVLTYLYWQGLIKSDKDKTYFLYKKGDGFSLQCENYKIHSGKPFKDFINISNNTKIKSPTYFSARAQMPLISFSNCISDMTHNGQLKNLKTYDKFYNGVQPQKPMMQDKEPYFNFNQKFLYLLKKDKTLFSFLEKDKFIFDVYRYQLHISELEAYIVQFDDKEYSKKISFQTHTKEYSTDELLCKLLIHLVLYDTKIKIFKKLNSGYSENPKYKTIFPNISSYNEHINKHLYKNLNINVDEYDENTLKSIIEKCNKFLKKCKLELLDEKDWILDTLYNVLNIRKEIHNRKVKDDNYDDSYIIFKSINKKFNDGFVHDDKNQIINTLLKYDILRVNFLDSKNKEKTFLNLSSGEKLYLNVLVNYAYTILQHKEKNVYLFDEIELSFHPAWQKKIIDNIIYLANKLVPNIKQHCIFTSHSPFLLSDIPKQSIVFLDKDENGNCKVVDGLKEKKQTFGANIHTLLSDSFFMEDGLMGEFAKRKIEEIIDYLNEKESPIKDNDEAQKFISIIGEPIIKNQLQKMLDSKRLIKIDEIDSIKSEIEDLEKRLQEIENANDKS